MKPWLKNRSDKNWPSQLTDKCIDFDSLYIDYLYTYTYLTYTLITYTSCIYTYNYKALHWLPHHILIFTIHYSHIHKKRRLSKNTGRLNRNLYDMLKFTERPKTPGIISKKNMAFPEGNKLFAGDLCANLDENDMVQFTKRSNWKWIV